MSYKKLIPLSVITIFAMLGCQTTDSSGSSSASSIISNYSSISISTPSSISEPINEGDFSLSTKDGNYSKQENIYTITRGGLYSLKGTLQGQIVVAAGDNDKIELSLEGTSIEYDVDSPIKVLNANKVEVKAKASTENLVKETREMKREENKDVGEGAINSTADLEINGSGSLVVTGTYNNGIHTSDDLEVQTLTLHVTAPNNALKGNDSVTINSGNLTLNSLYGQGIKTKNTDVSNKGNQRGSIFINGGSVYVDSLYTGLEAAYNVVVDQVDNTIPTVLNIKTGKKSTHYSLVVFDETIAAHGLIAANMVNIKNSNIAITSDDYAIHASYGSTFDNGLTGLGNVMIESGTISISSDDDALRADNTLTVSGGTMSIVSGTEGIEANHVNISGGTMHIFGTDDGINVSRKIDEDPTMIVSGGFINVTVASGDTDGIDSNGTFRQTGGTIISRGSAGTSSLISTALEADGGFTMTGGTFIAFNGIETIPVVEANVRSAYKSAHSMAIGNYSLIGENLSVTFTNEFAYSSFIIYSSSLMNNAAYNLKMNNVDILSWTQSSVNVSIN